MINSQGEPFYVKKNFVSDSTQISCLESLGHKDFKIWVSSKSETKIFFDIELDISENWCYLILKNAHFHQLQKYLKIKCYILDSILYKFYGQPQSF